MSGTPARLATIYDECFELVWRFASVRGVRAEALERVVTTAFAEVRDRLEAVDSGLSPRAVVAGIARHVVRRQLRRQSGASPQEPQTEAGRESSQLLAPILARMSESECEVFLLHEMEGLSVEEVSASLRVGERLVCVRLDEARRIYNVESARLRAERFWSSRPGPPEP